MTLCFLSGGCVQARSISFLDPLPDAVLLCAPPPEPFLIVLSVNSEHVLRNRNHSIMHFSNYSNTLGGECLIRFVCACSLGQASHYSVITSVTFHLQSFMLIIFLILLLLYLGSCCTKDISWLVWQDQYPGRLPYNI